MRTALTDDGTVVRMPPIRSTPIKTERTHEENQERAYIAASRRSDRSLEARVESARRASEIHKKRTGRSLRVREEDVMNEEMYEEEDDDLLPQARRIHALQPGFFQNRINSYAMAQLGMRDYLAQAIYMANNNNNQRYNPTVQQGNYNPGTMSPHAMNGGQGMNGFQGGMPQSPFAAPNSQVPRPSPHARSASVATPQQMYQQQQSNNGNMQPQTPHPLDTRRMSVPVQHSMSPGASSQPRSAHSSHPSTPHPLGQQMPNQSPQMSKNQQRNPIGSPPVPQFDSSLDAQMYPLTTQMPLNMHQLMGSNATHPSQIQSGSMGSMGSYSYNPNGKPKGSSNGGSPRQGQFNGLDQTISPAAMTSMHEQQSHMNAPVDFDDSMMFGEMGDFKQDMGGPFDFGSNANSLAGGHSAGFLTPPEESDQYPRWDEDLFNFDTAAAE